jgi:glycerol-3-phosphate dehydrogenase
LKRDFTRLEQEHFDLIVIGGGIIGTGIARDAALRGLHTLLVEKEDFACGTTSRSSRLIHGGLRYLRMLDFKLVRQDLREREILLNIAPHLVHRLEFVIPLLRSAPFYRFTLPFGLRLYDILAAGKSLPSWKHLSRQETLKMEPSLSDNKGLVGSCLYYDCQAEYMERLCLENALDAAENEACILNHAAMTRLLFRDGIVKGIEVKDTLSGEEYQANGRIIVNAGGPWADLVWNKLNTKNIYSIRKTKGIHLFIDKISDNALVLFAKSDGRIFFIIPWFDYSLIGTTDTDYSGDLDNVHADKSDIDYLVSETRNYFPEFNQDDIHYTTAGLRPLVGSGKKAESNISRAHRLIDHERRDDIKGFISVLGGKITAYRAIAEEAVNLVCKKLNVRISCNTVHTPLPGAPAVSTQNLEKAAREKNMPLETLAHLSGIYGSRYTSVLDYASTEERLGNPLAAGYPDILAQVKHAIAEEQALTVSDFMLRRSTLGLGPTQGQDAVESVAQEMALLLGWNNREKQKQVRDYGDSVSISQNFRKGDV